MPPKFVIVEIPVGTLGDGRKFVSDEDIAAVGETAQAFIRRFPGYWERDCIRQGFVQRRTRKPPR